jgi:multidrug resistance protein MdtO
MARAAADAPSANVGALPSTPTEPVTSASTLARLVFEPTPGRMEFALRVGAVCAATTLVGEMYRMPPDLALAVYVVFFVNAADRTRSVILSVVMTVLLTLCLLIVLGVAQLVMDHPTWKVLSIAILSVVLLFLGTASVIGEVASTVTLIVGYGLDTLSRLPVGDLATRAVQYAWLFVGMPAQISILFNLAMAPSPRTLVQRHLAGGLRCAAKLLTHPDRATRECAHESLRRDVPETPKLLKLAGLERVSPTKDIAALRQAALTTTAILSLADVADRDPEARPPASIVAPVAETLEGMAAVLADGGYPVEIELPSPDVGPLHARAAVVLRELRGHLRFFADPPPALPAAPKAHRGFFRPDAFTNSEYVQHALRTTGAAMTCYLIYTLLRWNGIHTCFITCYIVSLGTVGDSIEKLALRISGCLVGAAAGIGAIVFVIPHMASITQLLALVFLGTFMSGWVAGGSKHVSYAGFQMAFAFLLCVVQHYAAGSDMVTARDRIWGVLIGNAVSYVFFTRLWPVSVRGRIRERVVAALRHLRALSVATSRSEGLAAAGLVQADLAGIEEALVIAHLEPRSVRADAAWLERQERAKDEIGALSEVLVIGAGTDARAGVAVGERLGELADAVEGRPRTEGQRAPVAGRDAVLPAWEPFRSAVERGLGRLEGTLETQGEDAADALLART